MQEPHPWDLISGQPYIDADRLSVSLNGELQRNANPDFRTRLLVRDATNALESFWGTERFQRWLEQSPVKEKIGAIRKEDLGDPGYHNIEGRLVVSIKKSQLEQILELLGRRVSRQTEGYIAGSIPTIILGLSMRPTDDIDFVDEVPDVIREQRSALQQIEEKYGTKLAHVQSHYLPENWKGRCKFFGDFGKLRVYFVDEYDIFVSKLSSKREKHKDDIRVMSEILDKEKIRHRLMTDGKAFLDDPSQRAAIEENWHFIFRENL